MKMKFVASFKTGQGYSDNIFTKTFSLYETEDGKIFVNKKNEVILRGTGTRTVTRYTKSTTKKVGGAVAGGLLAGGFGAIVGALALGNNKREDENYDILLAEDLEGRQYEVPLQPAMLQKILLNSIVNG